jgi:uncharacterized protein (TIGR03435 family)
MRRSGRFLVVMVLPLAVCASIGESRAQVTESVNSVQFEAASVRRGAAGDRRSMALTPSGLSYTNVTLADSLIAAYGIERYQLIGPGWLARDRYVIAAKTGAPAEAPRAMRMLQSLPADRFGLKLHWETRELPVYVLRVTKDSPGGLKPVETRLGVVPTSGGMTFRGMTMSEFVDEFLSRLPSIDRAVINGTNLDGRYEFSLRVFDSDPPPGELKPSVLAGGPELFIHALEQVGLTLARDKRSVDVLLVDHAEKDPTEN